MSAVIRMRMIHPSLLRIALNIRVVGVLALILNFGIVNLMIMSTVFMSTVLLGQCYIHSIPCADRSESGKQNRAQNSR